MPTLKTVLSLLTFKKKTKMSQQGRFEATHTFNSRYNDTKVLADYLRTLPDEFQEHQFEMRVKGQIIYLKLPRELTTDEMDKAHKALRDASHARRKLEEDETKS